MKKLKKVALSFAILFICAGAASATESYNYVSYEESKPSIVSNNSSNDYFNFDDCSGIKVSYAGGSLNEYFSFTYFDYMKFGRFFIQPELTYAKNAIACEKPDYKPKTYTYTDEETGETYEEFERTSCSLYDPDRYDYSSCWDITLLYGINYEGLISLISVYGGNTLSISKQEIGFRYILGVSHIYNHIPLYSDLRIEASNSSFRNSFESKISVGYAIKF